MSVEIRRDYIGPWEVLRTEEPPPYEITGKYLFFSENRELLVNLARDELENNSFHEAKVIMEGMQKGSEFVLCLYYKDDSRKHELASKHNRKLGLKYRYWKSNLDTLEGKYSDEFLKKLPPEERGLWTGGRQ